MLTECRLGSDARNNSPVDDVYMELALLLSLLLLAWLSMCVCLCWVDVIASLPYIANSSSWPPSVSKDSD